MASKQFKDIYSTHPDYDPLLNTKLQLLYQGGFKIMQNAELFLERLAGLETSKAYQSRIKTTSYIPFLSQYITQFGASLFSESLEVKAQADASDSSTAGDDMTDDFYKEFLECCDLEGKSYHQFAKDILEKALSELCVYVSLDFPKGERINRAQEKADGLDKGYVCTIPYSNVINWKIDPSTGKFLWLTEFEEIMVDDNPLDEPKHYYQFKFRIMKKGKNGKMFGGWDVWQSEIMPITKKCVANTKFTEQPKLSVITSFPEINVWKVVVNNAYHVGQQVGPICQEYYQRRSFMVANANKTCVSVGVVTLGPEIVAPGDSLPLDIQVPETSKDIRKNLENDGWTVLRKTDGWADSIDIIEAKGESHKFIAEELIRLKESAAETLRQMNMTAAANTKALGRSAASKAIDSHGTSMLLTVYERYVKDFTKLLFGALAAGRQEDIRFTAEGLSTSEPTHERSQTITELTSFGVDILKFPDLWKNKYLNRVATELLDNNITDKERLELEDKFEALIDNGDFNALDPEEATAAGNKMAANTAKQTGQEEEKPIGKSGQPLLDEGSHLQTGEHIDGQVVHDQLSEDYKDKDIEFVKHIPWIGPSEVPLSSIDFSNKDNWQASQEPDKVDEFAEKMKNDYFSKPIILVNNPSNNNKMSVIDGHHRSLAALKNGQPVNAYIGQVGSNNGPWDKLHSKQVGSKQASLSSNQKTLDKEISNQVSKSEKP